MSKIGRRPIKIPNEAEIEIRKDEIKIKGPKGELNLEIPSQIKVTKEEKDQTAQLLVKKTSETKIARAFHGLYRNLIKNMVEGVSDGFEKELELHGLGYQVALKSTEDGKQKLVLSLGLSHPIEFFAPKGINFTVTKNKITVSGIDKQLVGQTAASIRAFKPPEPYKGKGIRYVGEIVKKKPGKAVVKGPEAATGG